MPVSFFEYDYPLLDSSMHKGIKIASIMDIALMKIIAIMQRGEKKDFIDLYYIITQGNISLRNILKKMNYKFPGIEFDTGTIYKALTWFDDAEKSAPLHKTGVKWEHVKSYFRNAVKSEFSGT